MRSAHGSVTLVVAIVAILCLIYWRLTLRIAIVATVTLAIYGGAQLAERLMSHG